MGSGVRLNEATRLVEAKAVAVRSWRWLGGGGDEWVGGGGVACLESAFEEISTLPPAPAKTVAKSDSR